jgi:hypothetical protein
MMKIKISWEKTNTPRLILLSWIVIALLTSAFLAYTLGYRSGFARAGRQAERQAETMFAAQSRLLEMQQRAAMENADARADAERIRAQLAQVQDQMQKMALDQASFRSVPDQTSPQSTWRSCLNAIQRREDRTLRLLASPEAASLLRLKGDDSDKRALQWLLEPLQWQEQTKKTASAVQGAGAQRIRYAFRKTDRGWKLVTVEADP